MQSESLPPSRRDKKSLWTGALRRPCGGAAAVLCAALALGGCANLGGSQEPKVSAATETTKPSPEFLQLAQKALADNRLADAERLVDRVLLTEPNDLEARLLRGEIMLAKGKPNQAMAVFSGLQELPEVSARARQGMGISLLLTDSPDAAVEHLKAAVDQDPKLWRAWNALGSYYDTKEDWAEATKAYDSALAEHPNDAMILSNRGFSYFMQGHVDQAIADMERSLRLDPSSKPTQINLRLAYAWNGQYVRALAGVSDKEMPEMLNNVGYVAMMRGDLENAEAYLMRAMEEDPAFNRKAWANLAHLRQIRELNAEGAGRPPATPRDITAAVTGK